MSNKDNLFKKFFDYAMGSGIVLLLGFISSPLITRLISPSEFGKFSMFNLFISILGVIILLGLDHSFVRYFYEEKEEDRPKLLRQAVKIPLLVCTGFSLVLIIFGGPLFKIFFEEYNLQLLFLIVLNNYFSILNRYVFLVVRMQQLGKKFSYLQIAQKLVNIVLIILFFLGMQDDFLVLVYSVVISNIFVVILGILLEKKFWLDKTESNLKTGNKEFIRFGIPLIFTFLIMWIFQSTDRLFIKHFFGYSELGVYTAAFSIVALLNAVQNAFSTFWVPVAYEKYKNKPDNKEFFGRVSRVIAFTMFLIGIAMVLFKDLIVLILGEEYRQASYIMPFLIFMPLMYTVSETTVLGINFKKKSEYHIIITISCAISNILGNLLLVPLYGAVGAAISTGLSYILFFSLRTFISKKLYSNDYGLVKFFICTINLSILALYASFNELDFIYIILGFENILLVSVLYFKDAWKLIPHKYKKKILSKKEISM